jgi:hypothetical protein
MASGHVMTTRWSDPQHRLLLKLKDKLGLSSMNDVLRLAVTRLAEAEGLLPTPPRK